MNNAQRKEKDTLRGVETKLYQVCLRAMEKMRWKDDDGSHFQISEGMLCERLGIFYPPAPEPGNSSPKNGDSD